MSLTVPSFPNLFILYGPNAQPRSGSFLSWIEVWSRYVAQAIVHLVEHGLRSVEVRRERYTEYNDELQVASDKLIWAHEAPAGRNYYINEFGRQTVNYPWRNAEVFARLRAFNPRDFHLA